MNRFFVNKNLIANGTLYIVGEDLHHMVKVLRLKRGDPVELCDGLGMEYKAPPSQLTVLRCFNACQNRTKWSLLYKSA